MVTRDSEFSALQLNNVYGNRVAVDNIIVNGTYAWPATESNNIINVDPLFVSAPQTVDGPLVIDGTDFSLSEGSPAINSGNPSYSPTNDIVGNPRPVAGSAIASTSFENATGGWTAFGSTVETSSDESLSGDRSLFTSDRTANWHSPRIVLNNLLDQGESYTFYVWVKLAEGETGTTQLTIKDTDENEYYNLTEAIEASDQQWTLLTADFTHDISNNFFLYVKGPTVQSGIGADYYIDDFSLVTQGSQAVDFENTGDIIDIGAYEFIQEEIDTTAPVITIIGDNPMIIELGTTFSDPGATATDNYDSEVEVTSSGAVDANTLGSYSIEYTAIDSSGNSATATRIVEVEDELSSMENVIDKIYISPNPVQNLFTLHNTYLDYSLSIVDILGKEYQFERLENMQNSNLTLNISHLKSGLYFIKIKDKSNGNLKILRLIKQ